MKKIINVVVSFLVGISISFPITSYAAGDPNIGGGGGGMGGGSSGYYWNETYDGVRVTIVSATTGLPVTVPIDLSNINTANVVIDFGKVCKRSYQNGAYRELTENLGGCFVDLMSGEYRINVLEPKAWDESANTGRGTFVVGATSGPRASEVDGYDELHQPAPFLGGSKLSQHISFLRDFFKTYKTFTDAQIDTIEIMLGRLYEKFGITDNTDFAKLKPNDYPILSDLYDLIENEYMTYTSGGKKLYTAESLQEILLGLHSMCKGAESKFFNGYTNITSSSFITFGVKGLLQASHNVKDAMLFNVLSYMSDQLLTKGKTVAGIDEFYLFLSNITAVEYIRNFSKRVRKKDSAVILASQNLEDFNIEGVKEYTRPLFAIPTHAFLFNAGNVDQSFYRDTLQIEKSEYELIKYPQRGVCLYKCGNERYNLEVHAPEYKEVLFGSAGGR